MNIHRKKNILITCAGGSGPIYLARRLKNKFKIFLAEATKQNIAAFLGFPFAVIPFGNSPAYVKSVKSLIKKWRIDYIVPGADEELVSSCQISAQGGPIVILPNNRRFIELCLNKKKLMEVLNKLKISHLLPYKKLSVVRYPALVKPNYGRGSRAVHIVNSARELRGYLSLYKKRFSQVLVQKYIEGEEYTVSVIVNNLNNIIGIVPKRVILKRGITRVAVSEVSLLIDRVCEKIVKKLKPCGPFNVQLKLFKGNIYVFEINPRLSTTSVLTDRAFGNEVELFIKYFNKREIKSPPVLKKNVFLYRYEENVFQ